jgi:hypothetical protein
VTDFADLQVAEQNMQHRGARCPAQLPVSGNRVTEQAEDETLQPRVHRSRYLVAARHFFTRAMRAAVIPVEVTTDRAPAYPRVLDELIPSALHTVDRYANNPVKADHGRLRARLRPMRGLKQIVRSALQPAQESPDATVPLRLCRISTRQSAARQPHWHHDECACHRADRLHD